MYGKSRYLDLSIRSNCNLMYASTLICAESHYICLCTHSVCWSFLCLPVDSTVVLEFRTPLVVLTLKARSIASRDICAYSYSACMCRKSLSCMRCLCCVCILKHPLQLYSIETRNFLTLSLPLIGVSVGNSWKSK